MGQLVKIISHSHKFSRKPNTNKGILIPNNKDKIKNLHFNTWNLPLRTIIDKWKLINEDERKTNQYWVIRR